jgi:CubicO group peptidase (beta-lactamase class C family)
MGTAIDGTVIDKVLRDAVDSGAVPHVAAIAASRDGVIYEGSAGLRAAGESDPVTVDTLFRIMSMTKMPCTVAALQQVEKGQLDLQAPVADVAIKDGITGPLGMDQTTFLMDDGQRPNSTPVHVKGEDGTWASIGEVLNQAPDYFAGGHGLYGPPSDYIKFEQALLRDGELGGARILQQSTVDEAFRNQIGDLEFPADLPTADPASSCDFRTGPGYKWGYGLLLNTADIPGMRRAWSGAWAGLCNTQFWIDRTSGVCASIYSNFLPFATPEAVAMYNDFEKALYAAL